MAMNFRAVLHLSLAICGFLSIFTLSEVRASSDMGQKSGATTKNHPSKKVKTAVSFTESWNEKLACTGSSAQGDFDCETYSNGKFNVKVIIPAANFGSAIDPSQFNEDTEFDIRLGNYLFSATLGNADAYVPGATKATFTLADDRCTAEDINGELVCPTKAYETIQIKMKPEQVTVSISAITGSDANGNTFEDPIEADIYEDEPTGAVSDTIPFEMNLGSLSVFTDTLPVAGSVVTRDVTDKNGFEDTLSKIRIKGKLPAADLTSAPPLQ
ncbi:hypothetical protein JJL52_03590 [Methylomicrobium sp. RS1]|jgi:hypothetical protein|nr:hypothetical protein [Methylomicrobium sp. RS1]